MRTSLLWALIFAFLATPLHALRVSAQGEAITYQPHIHAGTCEAPGEVAANLTDLLPPAGQSVGAGGTAAYSSYTDVQLPFDTIIGGQYVVDVHRSSDSLTVACGAISGKLDAGGALTIGLRPTGGAGFSGIAYLSAAGGDPSRTSVSTFLAETGAVAGQASPEATATDEATYVVTVRRDVTLLVGSLQRVNTLFDAPQLDDQAWVDQLLAELTLWQILHEEAQELTPPAELADFHARFVDALALLDSAADDIFAGLETGDQALLTQAGDKIDQAVAAIRALDGEAGTATPAAGG